MKRHFWRMFTGFLTLAVTVSSLPTYASETKKVVTLTTHNLYPYSYYNSKREFTGLAVDVVRCVFTHMQQPYKFEVVPWKRAQQMTENGFADGFFAGSQNTKRDDYAVMSAIIADQNWTWFLRKDSRLHPDTPEFKQTALVSSFLGANMQRWLISNGYKVDRHQPIDTKLLLRRLLGGRIDAALANQQVMEALLASLNAKDQVFSVLNRSKPLGVYFSKESLKSRPGFIEEFNSYVPECRRTAVRDAYEP